MFLFHCSPVHPSYLYYNSYHLSSYLVVGSLKGVGVVYDLTPIYLLILIFLVPFLVPSIYVYSLLAVLYFTRAHIVSFPSK